MDRNSDLSQIAVNANNIPDDSVDCGIRSLGWCHGQSCQRYARLRTFVIVLACAGLLQGACESYFRVSAKQAAVEYGYNPLIVEWLLATSGIVQALFALLITYWAHKVHPISWLAGLIMLQAAACVISVIPSIITFADNTNSITQTISGDMCLSSLVAQEQQQRATLTQDQSRIVTLVMLFVLQFALGLAAMAFYTIGIIYIDDNSPSVDSPAVIATAMAAKFLGEQIGSFIILGVGATTIGWWLGWIILAPLIFASGLMLGLFPKSLPKTVIHAAAQRIIEESRYRQFGSQFSTYIDDTNFGPSVKRLFNNKLLMFNLLGIMFIQAAVVNFAAQEESYLQSRFFLPYSEQDGLMQEWKANFVAYFLKPPVAAVTMLLGGLLISKLKLSGRKIVGINIALAIHLMAIYIAFIFIKCDVGQIAGITNGKLEMLRCSSGCHCTAASFMPVCPENSTVTYFSPCYAGCTMKTTINNVQLYEGCSCHANSAVISSTVRATVGACSAEKCSTMMLVFQILSLSAAGIVGMTTIGKLIISLRSVLPQDKGLALAMELLIGGLFTYVPAHLAYDVVTRTTCAYWTPEYLHCLLRETPKHGNILNVLSAALILVAIFFDVLVFIYAKGLNMYNCKATDVNYTPALYAPIPHDDKDYSKSPIETAMGGSPVTTTTTASPSLHTRISQPTRPAPNPDITVFRNPSSVTNSSAGDNSVITEPNSGVTYAQVVFPPDKYKPDDGTTSPKRMVVRADVPLHHLSAQDVRAQLNNLKSFHPENVHAETAIAEPNEEILVKPVDVEVATTTTTTTSPAAAAAPTTIKEIPTTTTTATANIKASNVDTSKGAVPKIKTAPPLETHLDDIRPQSPETDL